MCDLRCNGNPFFYSIISIIIFQTEARGLIILQHPLRQSGACHRTPGCDVMRTNSQQQYGLMWRMPLMRCLVFSQISEKKKIKKNFKKNQLGQLT